MMRLASIVIALVFVADQASKLLAARWLPELAPITLLPVLDLVLVHNRGAAFGFLAGAGGWQNGFFVGVALVASTILLVLIRRLPPGSLWMTVAFALVFGGAVGNLADRLLYGHVIDFIDFHVGDWHWPAFNVADVAITVGALMVLRDAFRPPVGEAT